MPHPKHSLWWWLHAVVVEIKTHTNSVTYRFQKSLCFSPPNRYYTQFLNDLLLLYVFPNTLFHPDVHHIVRKPTKSRIQAFILVKSMKSSLPVQTELKVNVLNLIVFSEIKLLAVLPSVCLWVAAASSSRAALLFITADSLFMSGLKRLFLQRFTASLGLLGSLLWPRADWCLFRH